MRQTRVGAFTLAVAFALALALPLLARAQAARAADISLNGVPVAGAEARPEVSVDITEFREGGSNLVRLIPGPKRYKVSIVSHTPIAILDGQLPVAAASTRFAVGAGNGRTFQNCLLAGLTSEGRAQAQRQIYALRCEDFTP